MCFTWRRVELPGTTPGCYSCLVNLCIPQTFEQTVKWLRTRFLAPGSALKNMHLWQCGTFHVFLTFGKSRVWIFSCIVSIYQLCDSGSLDTCKTWYPRLFTKYLALTWAEVLCYTVNNTCCYCKPRCTTLHTNIQLCTVKTRALFVCFHQHLYCKWLKQY